MCLAAIIIQSMKGCWLLSLSSQGTTPGIMTAHTYLERLFNVPIKDSHLILGNYAVSCVSYSLVLMFSYKHCFTNVQMLALLYY